jgi:hypothetical protein
MKLTSVCDLAPYSLVQVYAESHATRRSVISRCHLRSEAMREVSTEVTFVCNLMQSTLSISDREDFGALT